jgi:hypothetical protein
MTINSLEITDSFSKYVTAYRIPCSAIELDPPIKLGGPNWYGSEWRIVNWFLLRSLLTMVPKGNSGDHPGFQESLIEFVCGPVHHQPSLREARQDV